MPVFKNSDLHRRLASSSGGYGGFDLPKKDYTYLGTESDAHPYKEDTRSNFQKLRDVSKRALSTGANVVEETAKASYRRVSNLGETLGMIAASGTGQEDKSAENYRRQTLDSIRQLQDIAFDPNSSEEQKKRARKALSGVNKDFQNTLSKKSDTRKKVENLSVRKTAGDIAGITTDILSAGTYGAEGAATGSLYRASKIANPIEQSILRKTAEGALTGAALGGAGNVASKLSAGEKIDLASVARNAGLGAVLGSLGGASTARRGNRAVTAREEAAAAKTKALFHGVDTSVDDLHSKLNAEDAFLASKPDPNIKLLPSGEERLKSQLDEIDRRLDEFRTGKANANISKQNEESLTTLAGEPAGNPRLTKSGEPYKNSKSGVFAETTNATTEDSHTTAQQLRALMKARAEVQNEIDKIHNPVQGGDLASNLDAAAKAPDAPKVPTETPTVTTTAPKPRDFTPPTKNTIYKQPGFVKRIFTSESGKLNALGAEGSRVAQGLSAVRNNSETAQANFIKQIPTVIGLKKRDYNKFVDTLDTMARGGEVSGVSPKIQRAISEWQRMIPTIRQSAVDAGIDVGDLGDTYYPHNYSKLLSTSKGTQKAIDHLVKTGQADNSVEAANMLQHMKQRYATPFGHFENSRKLDLPGYDRGKDSLVSYVAGAFNKISHAEQFGANGEKAASLIDDIGKAKGDAAKLSALKSYMISSGSYQWDRPSSYLKGTSAIRSFNRLRSLGLSAILNAGQTTNTASVAGIWRTARAATKLLSKSEREYVNSTGVIIDSVLNSLREGSGVGNKLAGKLTAPGFNVVEDFNRSVAAEAGKSWATKLAKKAAKGNSKAEKILREKLGVEGEIGAKLTKEQEIQASRKLVENTQFKVDPQDLPGWASSPEGKMVSQFRTFAYKQTGFVYNQLLKEAVVNKNPAPLARFLAVGVPIGYVSNEVRKKLRGEDTSGTKGVSSENKSSLFGDLVTSLQNVGAFGMLSDVGFLGSNIKSQRFPQYLASSLAGPTAGLGLQTVTNIQQAAAGNSKALARQGLRTIPVAGAYASNQILPYGGDEFSKTQQGVLDAVPPTQKQSYADLFRGLPSAKDSKTNTSNRIKEEIKNGNFAKAKRLSDEHNKLVDEQLNALSGKIGEVPPEIRDYVEGNYKTNYQYYSKHRNDQKNRYGL